MNTFQNTFLINNVTGREAFSQIYLHTKLSVCTSPKKYIFSKVLIHTTVDVFDK